jgi:hypothetical protein
MRDTKKKLAVMVRASGTTLTEIFGVGPVIAAPFTLATQPVCEGGSDETSTEIHAIDPSDLPLPAPPGGNGKPPAFAPA